MRGRLFSALIWIAIPLVLVVILLLVIKSIDVPTPLKTTIISDKLRFRVADDKTKFLNDGLPFSSITISKVASMSLHAEEYTYAFGGDSFSSVESVEKIEFSGFEEQFQPKAIIWPKQDSQKNLGILSGILLDKGDVVEIEFTRTDHSELIIRVINSEVELQIDFIDPYRMQVDYIGSANLNPNNTNYGVFNIIPLAIRPLLNIKSYSSGVALSLTPSILGKVSSEIVSLPIDQMSFSSVDFHGNKVSTVFDGSEFVYLNLSNLTPKQLNGGEFFQINNSSQMKINTLNFDWKKKLFMVGATGYVEDGIYGVELAPNELQLSLFDKLVGHPIIVFIGALFGVLLPIFLKIYKFFNQSK